MRGWVTLAARLATSPRLAVPDELAAVVRAALASGVVRETSRRYRVRVEHDGTHVVVDAAGRIVSVSLAPVPRAG